MKRFGMVVVILVLMTSMPSRLKAEQTEGSSQGSPGATQTIGGSKILPAPSPKYSGVIQENANQSQPWWPPQIVPPKGAPNVLLIMTDDVGFGAPSTFGGVIPTLALDRVAKMGLRYTSFHSTALCSPTRAALITGRNHHSAHTGVVIEVATGYPGYNSIIGKNTASIGEILKQNGYATSWFGKDHNTPAWMASQLGPFDNWPIGYGFQYFYGFVGGDTSQWQPNLFRNTTPIQPYLGKPSWNLNTAMADDAIQYLHQMNELNPKQPFFVYYVPGAAHAPHHPPSEWITKFKGKFDNGWNALREQIFANQKKLGVIPVNAKLTPWPDSLPKWDSLSAEDQKLFARQAEVYAAYLAYSDHEIGRVIQAIEDMGKLDNTLVMYISGDNGASAEGTLGGTPNEMAALNGVVIPPKDQMKFLDSWGTDQTYPHLAVGWACAFDTPYKWTKQIASHFGGTRQGMAIAWPKRIKDTGGIRPQFHHVIDVVPTILEACGIQPPTIVNGTQQKPIEGVSMTYTWDKTAAQLASHHETQYFEMFGNRAIYHRGWIAATTPPAGPWTMGLAKMPKDVMNGYKWELYDLNEDPSEFNNLASKNPGKLKELQKVFVQEAKKYDVFPLDNSVVQRVLAQRPDITGGRNVFEYSGVLSYVPHGAAPAILNRSYTMTADVEIPQGGAEGMLVTHGGRFGGYGFYILKGKPVFLYKQLDFRTFRWEGEQPIPEGKHRIAFNFKYNGPGFGKSGTGELSLDGKAVAVQAISYTVPFILPIDEYFDVGIDTGTSVSDQDYQVPFAFNGKLVNLRIELQPLQLSTEERKQMAGKAKRDSD